MARQYGLIGVPSSAGAKTPGIEKAPAALREVGLVAQLEQADCRVIDHGDLAVVRHKPDKTNQTAQNLDTVVEIATKLANEVSAMLDAGEIPIVIGGDCSISVGMVAGYMQHNPATMLLYMDGGVDLEIPETNSEGNLDSMGVAHMIGEPGATQLLSHVGPRFPLLTPEQIVYFGCEQGPTNDEEEQVLAKHSIRNYRAAQVRGRAKAAANEALASLESRPFIVHFDVDVIDFVDFPIADVPAINQGLTLAEAIDSLQVFVASPQFKGLVITEVNPDHMDGDDARKFVREFTSMFAAP